MHKSWRERTLEHHAVQSYEQREIIDIALSVAVDDHIRHSLEVSARFDVPIAPVPALAAFKGLARQRMLMRSNVGDDVLHDAVLPATGLPIPSDGVRCKGGRLLLRSCLDAEHLFSKAVTQARYHLVGEQDTITIHHTKDRKPVLFQKSAEQDTALSLVPIMINKRVFPSGVIFAVQPVPDAGTETGTHHLSNIDFATREIDDVRLTPIRISPWAFDDELDRSLFGVDASHQRNFNGRRARMVRERTLGDFQSSARHIMELCRPPSEPILPLGLENPPI